MVEDLDQGIIFVGDGGVIEIDQAVGTTRKQAGRLGRMEYQVRDIVTVTFDILKQRLRCSS